MHSIEVWCDASHLHMAEDQPFSWSCIVFYDCDNRSPNPIGLITQMWRCTSQPVPKVAAKAPPHISMTIGFWASLFLLPALPALFQKRTQLSSGCFMRALPPPTNGVAWWWVWKWRKINTSIRNKCVSRSKSLPQGDGDDSAGERNRALSFCPRTGTVRSRTLSSGGRVLRVFVWPPNPVASSCGTVCVCATSERHTLAHIDQGARAVRWRFGRRTNGRTDRPKERMSLYGGWCVGRVNPPAVRLAVAAGRLAAMI